MAGWFPDPDDQSVVRYWDGERWTDFVARPEEAKPPRRRRGLLGRLPRVRLGIAAAGLLTVLALAVAGQRLSPTVERPTALTGSKSTSASTTHSPDRVSTTSPDGAPATRVPTTPDLAGLTVAQAATRLASSGLRLGAVIKRPSEAQPGTVIGQVVEAGSGPSNDLRVDLVIAVPYLAVPAVVGQSRASAVAALASAGLVVRVTVRDVPHGSEGSVLSQRPAAGSAARPGSEAWIVVARVAASRPTPKPMPSPTPTSSSKDSRACTPGYAPCLPPASDYDCAGTGGNGPRYVGRTVRVTGSDPYALDPDHDGYGCN